MEVEPQFILLLVFLVPLFVISRRFCDGLLFFDLGRYFAVFCVRVLFFIPCCLTYTCRNVVVEFSFLSSYYYFSTYNLQCSFNERVFGFCVSPGKSL